MMVRDTTDGGKKNEWLHENSSQHCLFLSMKSAHFPHEFYFSAKLKHILQEGNILKALAWTSNTSCLWVVSIKVLAVIR
jgi:hypothetical protein